MDNQIQAPENGAGAASVAMPGYAELISDSFTKSLTSWPLFLLVTLTALVSSVAMYVLEYNAALSIGATLSLFVLVIVSVVVNVLSTIVAIMYYLRDGAESIQVYAQEVIGSAWSYLLIMFLSTLVLLSGFILFIIPCLILSTYLMFTLHSRAAESKTGMDALVRSTEIVRGYWWAMTGRLIILTLAIVSVFLVVGFLLGVVAVIASVPEAAADAVFLLGIEPIFSSLGTLISLYAITVLYKFLVATKAGTFSEPSAIRGWYVGLAVSAPFLIAAVLALITLGFINEFNFVEPDAQEQILLEMDTSV